MGLRHMLTFLLCMSIVSCKEFKHQFESLAVQCGTDPGSIDSQLQPWLILNDKYEGINPQDLLQMDARFIDDNRKSTPLPISSKGCVFAPHESGVIQVLGRNSGMYASLPQHDKNQRELGTIILKRKYPLDISLNCPKTGYFSRGALESPLQINSNGSLEAVDLKLTVTRRGQAERLSLFNKPFGKAELALSANLLPPQFAEGDYDLHLIYENSMESWDHQLAPVSESTACPLTVHRIPPTLRGLPGGEGRIDLNPPASWPIKQGEFLTVYAESAIPVDVHVCREKIAGRENELAVDQGCAAEDICQRPENFSVLEQKPVSDPGVFHYFFYALDRAGNQSAMQCKRLVVSESAPHLEVQWGEPAWNIPLAVMDKAEIDVQAKIALSHPALSTAHLLQSLECKVDFTVEGKMTLRSSGVRCTSGRCSGRELSDWTPCDQQLRFSLSRFWAQEKAQRMAMQLHVRAQAADLQVEQAIKTIWVYPQRFEPQLVNSYGFAIFEADDQSILLQQRDHVIRWDELSGKWVETGLPEITGDKSMLRLAQDKNRNVYAVWRNDTDYGVVVWKDKTWVALPANPEIEKCEELSVKPYPNEGMLCETKDSIIMWHDQAWHKTELPCLRIEEIAPPEINEFVRKKDGQDYLSCHNGHIFQRRGEEPWTLVELSAPMEITKMVLDAQDRLWTVGKFWLNGRLEFSIQFLGPDRWHGVEPPLRTGILEEAELSGSASGDIRFGDALWDEASGVWKRPDEIQLAYPEVGLGSLAEDHRGELWRVYEGDFVLRSAKGIRLFPVTSFGITETDLRDKPLYDNKGRFWFISLGSGAVYRVDPVSWQTYAEEAGFKRTIRSFIYPKSWLNPSGQLEYFEQDVGLVQSGSDGWKQLIDAKVPDRREPLMELKADRLGNYYGFDASRLFLFKNGQAPELLHEFPEYTYFTEGVDAQGRPWIYQFDSKRVWILDGNKLVPIPLPIDDRQVEDLVWYNYPDQIGVKAGNILYLWDEVRQVWKESSYDGSGPFGQQPWDVAGPHQFIAWESEGRTFINGTQTIALPLFEGFAAEGQFKFIRNTLFYLSSDRGLYYLREGAWKPLLNEEMLEKRGFVHTSMRFTGMTLDTFDRLWVTGSPFRLLRLDLNDPAWPEGIFL